MCDIQIVLALARYKIMSVPFYLRLVLTNICTKVSSSRLWRAWLHFSRLFFYLLVSTAGSLHPSYD